MAAGDEQQRRARVPGLLNASLVAVVVVLVAAVALTARQDPPPTVAEFAPQAVEQIREALPEQAEAPGQAAPGGDEPGEAPPEDDEVTEEDEAEEVEEEEPEIERARVRRCVGDPPRQTEDPQSPPCVPYFDGDNGGSTYQGVTEDEIRIAWPEQDFGGASPAHMDALVAHFNQRYEFYGRRIVLEPFSPTGGTFAQPNPPDMIADAVHVDEQIQAFATLGYPDRKGSERHYFDELARRGVVSSSFRLESTMTGEAYRGLAPYRWNFAPSMDMVLGGLGDFVCRTLAHQPPQGGGADGTGQDPLDPIGGDDSDERVFGLVWMRPPDQAEPPLDVLRGALGACGVELAVDRDDAWDSPSGNSVVLQMQDAGVTSVIYLGGAGPLQDYMNAATSQGYFPEWIVSTYLDVDLDNVFQPGTAPPEQARNVLGITTRNRLLPRQQMPWYWALRENAPGEDPVGGNYYPLMARYTQLLQLASGIQLAGPELTPETFAAGLQGAVFPNPGAGGPPYYQAAVDYRGRHTAVDTAALFYYSTEDQGTVDPSYPGAVCYVEEGVRYGVGRFPSGPQPFFEAPCR